MNGIAGLKKWLLTAMLFTVLLFAYRLTKQEEPTVRNNSFYRMTIKDNQVVLYKGESFITVYADIVPSNLPADDRLALKEGILFKTRGEADRAAEDFDG